MPATNLPPGYLNTPEAASYLGYRPHTLECWRSGRIGPVFTKLPTGRVYYQRAVLDLYMRGGYSRTGGAR